MNGLSLSELERLLRTAAKVLAFLRPEPITLAFGRGWDKVAHDFESLVTKYDCAALEGLPDSPNALAQRIVEYASFPTTAELHDLLLNHWRARRGSIAPHSRNAFFGASEATASAFIDKLADAYRAELVTLASFASPHVVAALGPDNPTKRQSAWCEAHLEASLAAARLWTAVGVGPSAAHKLAASLQLGSVDIPDSPVVAIAAPPGAGKSLCLLRAYQRALSAAHSDATKPLPIWIPAEDGRAFDATLRQARARGDVQVRGIQVFADTTFKVRAEITISELRAQTRSIGRVTFVVTSREPLEGVSSVALPQLTAEQSLALVREVSGSAVSVAAWPRAMRDLLSLPLFAVLAGAAFAEAGRSFHSRAEILSRITAAAIGTQPGIHQEALQRAAVRVVECGGGAVPESELGDTLALAALARDGRLVVKGGALSFPINVVADWYAAEALANSEQGLENTEWTPERLERWRYALMILVASKPQSIAGPILVRIVHADPGFGADLVSESVPAWDLGDAISAPPEWEAAQTLAQAWSAWKTGLQKLATLTIPLDDGGTIIAPTVRTRGSAMIIETVFEGAGVERSRWFRPGRRSSWAWRATLEDIAKDLAELFRSRALPSTCPALLTEEIWLACLNLTERGSLYAGNIQLEEAEEAILDIPDGAVFRGIPNPLFTCGAVRRELVRLRASGAKVISAPWPAPSSQSNTWPALDYRDPELLDRTRAIFEAALCAYSHLVEEWFEPLRHQLAFAQLMPFRLVGALAREQRNDAGLDWYVEAIQSGSNVVDVEFRRPDRSREFFEALAIKNLVLRPRARMRALYHSETLRIFGARPVTDRAYTWLWEDLKLIGLVSGSMGDPGRWDTGPDAVIEDRLARLAKYPKVD